MGLGLQGKNLSVIAKIWLCHMPAGSNSRKITERAPFRPFDLMPQTHVAPAVLNIGYTRQLARRMPNRLCWAMQQG
ncbi:hypothetical protein HNQ96_003821 [Aminobacter lissarensis]|uniref:Uncharacterized protein n=1 Tax=Aminobacter carboxidus TaxID=376165 RepID=A0A8E1WH78_9HYPH|nr:hypothetical protein [Aminobacter lissarensis]MBB6467938.1 hypothetical protein [Aminobacter lissarensis]